MKRNATLLGPVTGTNQELRNTLDGLAIELTHEEIAHRAYQLYKARGSEHGRDLQDWLQAESELRQFLREAVEKVLTAEGLYAAV